MPTAAPAVTSAPIDYKKLLAFYEKLREEVEVVQDKAKAWLATHHETLQDVKTASQQLVAATSLAGSMIMNKGQVDQMQDLVQAPEDHSQLIASITEEEHQAIMAKMQSLVQMPPGHLEKQDELYLEQQLSDMLGFQVTAELEGHRLNHLIGIMGGEQHLKRFPTDTLDQHDAYRESGIAPNRGAFGWFTDQGQLTEQAIQREKYYFAVQTLYLPDWNTNHKELKPFYKFRKMIAINPAEEVAVVGVVGDAGPAMWVKKQFGGSPEVIREGKIWSKSSRGRVMLFFVDDPEDKIPLGPIELKAAKLLAERNHE
jgi:hypothetical protein